MKKIVGITGLLLCLAIPVNGQQLFDQLTSKEWNGSGTLMGADATFKMNWETTLDKSFVRLEFRNQRITKIGDTLVFKAHAYYKLVDDSTIEGMWFDSRGIYFPLSGTITKTELTIDWGTPETEQGRTIYTLKAPGNIETTDFILRNSEYLKFGNAAYN